MAAKIIIDTLAHLTPFDLVNARKIRIGSANDGGYVMVDRFSVAQDVLSYGLSWNVTFDMDLAQRGHRIVMFDHTIDGLPVGHPNFNYIKQGVGTRNDSDPLLDTVDSHIERFGLSGNKNVLKMDVEGAEWDVLDELSIETLWKFEQIVLELHDFHLIADPAWGARTSRVLSKLAANFHLHHVHANNCAPIVVVDGVPVADVIEVSYVRRDLVDAVPSITLFPTSLDACNDPNGPDHLLFFYPFHPGVDRISVSSNVEAYRSTTLRVHNEAQVALQAHQTKIFGNRTDIARIPSIIRKDDPSLDILILSVHPVLEYDQIRIFESLGHRVFSMGFYTDRAIENNVRPMLDGTEWHSEMAQSFTGLGCRSDHNGATRWRVSPGFMKNFDLMIVDHDIGFIQENWNSFLATPVVWRTIGQDDLRSEAIMRPYRAAGAKVVRWSPEQRSLEGYIGADTFVRASADPAVWAGWTGSSGRIVTFNNDFEARAQSLSFDFWKAAVEGFPADLYGLRNDGIAEWRGTASFADQVKILRDASVAFVTGTRPAPYTLGFIEAWMTGVPVVHLGRQVSAGETQGVYEIDRLIENGKTGVLVDNVDEARKAIDRLLNDREFAEAISLAARARAVEIFGVETVTQQWRGFLQDGLGHVSG